MDKIYSRKRIGLPKIVLAFSNPSKKPSPKKKRIMMAIMVLIIAIATANGIIQAITPIYVGLCKDRAKSVATIISNSEATAVMKDYEYEDIISIYRDKDDKITMLKSNIIPINKIISDVGEKIQKRIDTQEDGVIYIRLGSFLGSKILAGRGPNVPIKLSVIGSVETDLRSEFKAAGINQTLHRIYLQVDCKIQILTPFSPIEENISNQVLLAENIIVGITPDSYYNLEGLKQEQAVDVIE